MTTFAQSHWSKVKGYVACRCGRILTSQEQIRWCWTQGHLPEPDTPAPPPPPEQDTHGDGFLPGDTADTYRWILVPSSTVEELRAVRVWTGVNILSEKIRGSASDIVARWDAAKEEIEL